MRQVDWPALEEALQHQHCWPRVIQVLPNGEEPLPLIAFLLTLDDDPPLPVPHVCSHCEKVQLADARKNKLHKLGHRIAYRDRLQSLSVDSVGAEYRALLRAAIDLLLALQCMDATLLISASVALEAEALAQLNQRKGRVHAQTPALARWFAELGRQLVLPMSQGICLEQDRVNARSRNWWTDTSPLIQRSQSLRDALRRIDRTFVTLPVLERLDAWLGELSNQLSGLRYHVGADATQRAEVFLVASSWFAACGLRNMELGFWAKGLLMLHRCSEWLLMAKAVERGLITFDTVGGRYSNPQYYELESEKLGFAAHLKVLKQTGDIKFHEAEGMLRDLNDWRNVHPLTHHMSAASSPTAVKLFYDLLHHLPRLADSAVWDNALAGFALTPPLSLGDLLDPTRALRGAVVIQ